MKRSRPKPIPHVPQVEKWDCGIASALSVLEYYGKSCTWLSACTNLSASEHRAVHPANLEVLFWRYDLKTLAGQMDLEDLKYQTGRGRAIITPVDFGDGGHYISVYDYFRGRIHYTDCESGLESIQDREFDLIWHDWDSHGNPYDHWGIVVGK